MASAPKGDVKKGEVNELLTLLRAANSPANTDKTGKRKRDVIKKVSAAAPFIAPAPGGWRFRCRRPHPRGSPRAPASPCR